MKSRILLAMGVISMAIGCSDRSPPPPRADVPPPGVKNYPPRESEPIKPLPDEQPINSLSPRKQETPQPSQPIPEAEAFVDAYNKVGRPRIVVILNRTLDGKVIPPASGPSQPLIVSLHKGQYDEAEAGNLNYDALESAVADLLSCNNRVTIVTGSVARLKLSEQQLNSLHSGVVDVRQQLGELLDVDVLVQMQGYPIQQSPTGLKVRLVGQVSNTKGGESLGRPSVDLQLPGDSQEIARSARALARSLMSGMIDTWYGPKNAEQPKATTPAALQVPSPVNAPATQPASSSPALPTAPTTQSH